MTAVVTLPLPALQFTFEMFAPDAASIPVENGLDFVEWGFAMLEPGEAMMGDSSVDVIGWGFAMLVPGEAVIG